MVKIALTTNVVTFTYANMTELQAIEAGVECLIKFFDYEENVRK